MKLAENTMDQCIWYFLRRKLGNMVDERLAPHSKKTLGSKPGETEGLSSLLQKSKNMHV